jgi:hypothetical protein
LPELFHRRRYGEIIFTGRLERATRPRSQCKSASGYCRQLVPKGPRQCNNYSQKFSVRNLCHRITYPLVSTYESLTLLRPFPHTNHIFQIVHRKKLFFTQSRPLRGATGQPLFSNGFNPESGCQRTLASQIPRSLLRGCFIS